ncbi:MAG: DUF2007 domain-containing protein [Pseudomonadota bacterium]
MFNDREQPLRVYSAETLTQVALVRNVLAAAGIETELRNEHLGSIAGELPPISAWPELWLINVADVTKATQLVADYIAGGTPSGPAWRCEHCGSDNEAQFHLCWNCGASAPA